MKNWRDEMKEEEARKKICPIMSRPVEDKEAENEEYYLATIRCKVSECMFWVWHQDKSGGRCEIPTRIPYQI
jgi:hypothetical protein